MRIGSPEAGLAEEWVDRGALKGKRSTDNPLGAGLSPTTAHCMTFG